MTAAVDQSRSLPPDPAGTGQVTATPYVTVILPCYNEQGHVMAEVERICAAMDASGYRYELLAVDDASTDETLARLYEAAPRFPQLQVVPSGATAAPGRSAGSAPSGPGAKSWSGPTPT